MTFWLTFFTAAMFVGLIILAFIVEAQSKRIYMAEQMLEVDESAITNHDKNLETVRKNAATALSKWEAWERDQGSTTTDIDLPNVCGVCAGSGHQNSEKIILSVGDLDTPEVPDHPDTTAKTEPTERSDT